MCPDFANVTTYTQLVVGSTYFVPCWWVYLSLQKLRIMKVHHNLNSLCPRWNSYSHSKHKQVTTPACTMGYSFTPPTDEDSILFLKKTLDTIFLWFVPGQLPKTLVTPDRKLDSMYAPGQRHHHCKYPYLYTPTDEDSVQISQDTWWQSRTVGGANQKNCWLLNSIEVQYLSFSCSWEVHDILTL